MNKRRWLTLAVLLPVYAAVLAMIVTWLGAILGATSGGDLVDALNFTDDLDLLGDSEWWGYVALPALILAVTQLVFIAPVCRRRPPRGDRGVPLLISLILGAGIAAVLTFAVGLAVASLVSEIRQAQGQATPELAGGLLLLLAASWAFWGVVLVIYTRETRPDRLLGRLLGWLLAGTLLEVLTVIPMDVMVRRRTDCYCLAGTYLALCIAVVAVLWLTGPGLFLVLTARRRRAWADRYCERCGYEKGPSPGASCPECSHRWDGSG